VDPDGTCRRCAVFNQLERAVLLDVERVDDVIIVTVETPRRVVGCPTCGVIARVKDRRTVELVDLAISGTPSRLRWRKRRFCCPEPTCPQGAWTETEPTIASTRLTMTDRAGRWITYQVGHDGRTVAEVARELGCDWHTVNDAVVAYGEALVDDPARIGDVHALGLDEHLFVREGERRRRLFVTAIADVEHGQLLDLVPDRVAAGPIQWLEAKGTTWLQGVATGTLDLSASYRSVFDRCVPHATLVADPFHVVRVANTKLEECRRRVQQESLGHRGRKHDPLFRSRRLLTMAKQRLGDDGTTKVLELLATGDVAGQVTAAWHAKEAVRELYAHADEETAAAWIDELIDSMADQTYPPEVRSLGRTLARWRDQIIAWHRTHVSNGPTEALNNLAKRVKRVAFGFRSFRHYRVRVLLYAGKPDWSLLKVVDPR
jgi:transposase